MSTSDLPFNVTDLTMRQRLTTQLITVTPDMAREWLARNTKNRRVRIKVVAAYARDMRSGRWLMTGEGIKFSVDGVLIDGQHRLLAVIEADRPVVMLVITGLHENTQDVMDTGSKRLASDMLTLSGHVNGSLLAAATKWAILYDENRLYTDRANRNVTHADIHDYVSANPAIEEAVSIATGLRAHVDLQPALLAACFWITRQVDGDAAAEFWSRLADGVGLPAASPILALRGRLRQIKKNRTRVEPEALMSITIRAWNAWRTDRSLTSIPTHKAGVAIRCPRAE